MSVGGIVHKNLANDHEEMKALQSPKSDELQINHKLMNVTRSLRQKWRSSTTTSVGISQGESYDLRKRTETIVPAELRAVLR